MRGWRIWVIVHVSVAGLALFVSAVSAEILFANLPLLMPFVPMTELRWGLLLPCLTAAVGVALLDSGFGRLEVPYVRRHWRARTLWFLIVLVASTWPALIVRDGLAESGSLRNRLLIFGFTSLLTLAVPAGVAVLPCSFILMAAMLLAGAGQRAGGLAGLLDVHASGVQMVAALTLATAAGAVYALVSTGRFRGGIDSIVTAE